MFYITGDTHGNKERFAILRAFSEPEWTANDYLIICGDFGYLNENTEEDAAFLDELEKKPYTILFCDGNHENFSVINSYPEEEWNGGRIHRIRKNIIHLMRGCVFEIDGRKIFVMGGAFSIDRDTRVKDVSWWEEEQPSAEEYDRARENLERAGNKVDFIITHTAPASVVAMLCKRPCAEDMQLTGFFENIARETEFGRWYFGHWHTDRPIHNKFRALYFDVECEE